MIDEKKFIEEIKKIDLKESMKYMHCGCTLEQYNNEIGYILNKIISLIENMTKLDQWISVEERLPEEDVDVLVTDGEDMMVGFYRDDAKAWDNVNYGWVERNNDDECPCKIGKVIAWMPLPDGYLKEN